MRFRPIVSIIIPSYHHVDFVSQAVNSVLDQTIKDIEVIVIDDGSTDGTPEAVEKIDDSRIRLIRFKENRRKQTRNVGLALARGKYIAFQNSDDVWHPEKLKKQLDIFPLKKDIIACFTGVKVINEADDEIEDAWPSGAFTTTNRSNTEWLRHFFFNANCLCITSAMVRKKYIKKIGGFRGSLIQLSDLDLWVRLAALGNFHIIPEKLTSFRKVEKGNLSMPSPRNMNRFRVEFTNVLENYTKPPILNLLPEIFSKDFTIPPSSATILKAYLASIAWKHNSPSHRLMADRIMAEIIDDPTAREELSSTLGAEMIRKFYEKRGDLRIALQKHQ